MPLLSTFLFLSMYHSNLFSSFSCLISHSSLLMIVIVTDFFLYSAAFFSLCSVFYPLSYPFFSFLFYSCRSSLFSMLVYSHTLFSPLSLSSFLHFLQLFLFSSLHSFFLFAFFTHLFPLFLHSFSLSFSSHPFSFY